MPWWALHETDAEDLRAMYQFIKSLGPPGEPAPAPLPADRKPAPPYMHWPAIFPHGAILRVITSPRARTRGLPGRRDPSSCRGHEAWGPARHEAMGAVTWHTHGCRAACDACSGHRGLQSIAQQPLAPDTGERGWCVAEAALCCSPVQVKRSVRLCLLLWRPIRGR